MSHQTTLFPPNSRLQKNIKGLIYFIVCILSGFQYSIRTQHMALLANLSCQVWNFPSELFI